MINEIRKLVYGKYSKLVVIPPIFLRELDKPRVLKCDIIDDRVVLSVDCSGPVSDFRRITYSNHSESSVVTLPAQWFIDKPNIRYVKVSFDENKKQIIINKIRMEE